MSERERAGFFTLPKQPGRTARGKNPRSRSVALLTLLAFAGCTSEQTSSGDKTGVRGSGAPLGLAVQNPVLAAKLASKRVVWVVMKDQGNLTAAKGVKGWKARGEAVHGELKRVADSTQTGVRGFLTQRKIAHKPHWIVNAIRVEADQATIDALSKRTDVAQIVPDRVYEVPPPQKVQAGGVTLGTEWGLESIRAPEVWSTFGVKGEGIVIANIDTGVQFDHPALQGQYRGSQAGGGYDHNYNWFDPAAICGNPANGPCDNAGHGTHTMGTMVGDDGSPGDNQIGVAPGAKWIAAKGCEDSNCSLDSLLASAEWILAPTDLSGQNPRPDLRPNIVNNSWGGGGGDPFFQSAVQAWVAAGIFPAFAAGNEGPSCGTLGSPGDYPESYGVAAYDSGNAIAYFSSRGPSAFGNNKPNIAAPGVNVRSSVPGDAYDWYSGTSMATPHLAGTIALMWAAAPSLVGDIAATRALLDLTAIDTDDTSCGGTPENNAIWGEGRLDAFAAVDAAPRGPTGYIAGGVSDFESGEPLVGAQLTARGADGRDRIASTGADGAYNLRLPVGIYDLTVHAFGYLPQVSQGVAVAEGATTTQAFSVPRAPNFPLSGIVRDADGAPVEGARVNLLQTQLAPAVTDADGHYTFANVPVGDYDVLASAGRCYGDGLQSASITQASTLNFTLDLKKDSYGYSCRSVAYAYIEATNVIANGGDDITYPVTLPFPFTYYGETYGTANVSTNGVLSFLSSSIPYFNTQIPDAAEPNAAIYAAWDDLVLDGTGSIRTEVVGTAPNRKFVIEWRDLAQLGGGGGYHSFEIILSEAGQIALQYATDGTPSSTIGIEDGAGAVGLQYSFNEAPIEAGTSILYALPPSGVLDGSVTDQNDGLAVPGSMVRAMSGDTQVRATRADASGHYRFQVPVGTYVIEAESDHYETARVTRSIANNGFYSIDFALRTPRMAVAESSIQLIAPQNQVRRRTLTLSNTGSSELAWTIEEAGGVRQLTASTAKLARNTSANPHARDTRSLFAPAVKTRSWTPAATGDVLASFTPTGLTQPWGVGFDGQVWLSDSQGKKNAAFTPDGAPTGAVWETPWADIWGADMAYDAARNLMCQVNVGGDNGIYCWNPTTGAVVSTITGTLPWTGTSQRGLAYRADDDTFYVGGWNQGIIYHIKGLSYPDKGEVISSCTPSDGSISGLAWNGNAKVLWASTNSDQDTIYELNADDCTVLSTLSHPAPGYNGTGIEMDALGNLWTLSMSPSRAYLLESGVPAFTDVPWLSLNEGSGLLAPGQSHALTVSIDTKGLTPGVYLASIYLRSNSAREPNKRIPVSLIVTAYQKAANAGGNAYTDSLGDPWAADKAYSAGSWGYVQKGKTASTTKAITGTTDPTLYKTQRVDPYAYRYDNVPNGVYEVDLRFAEIQGAKVGKRLFDVIVENTLVMPAHDIRYEVGQFAADPWTFFVEVTDGRMDVRFVPRAGFDKPVINALRITHRPDR